MALNESSLEPAYHSRVQALCERLTGENPETGLPADVAGGGLIKRAGKIINFIADGNRELADALQVDIKRFLQDIKDTYTDGFRVKDDDAIVRLREEANDILQAIEAKYKLPSVETGESSIIKCIDKSRIIN